MAQSLDVPFFLAQILLKNNERLSATQKITSEFAVGRPRASSNLDHVIPFFSILSTWGTQIWTYFRLKNYEIMFKGIIQVFCVHPRQFVSYIVQIRQYFQ